MAIESGGAATVTATTFRSSDGDITAVSVAEGGSFTVGESQLVGADGSADPFPCDGTLPDCAGEHTGSVVVEGPSAVNMAAPLVCDVETGECLAMPAALLAAGVTAEEFGAYLTAGVAMNADPVCFTSSYITVLDDPNRRPSAGQGNRCDAADDGYSDRSPERGHASPLSWCGWQRCDQGPFGRGGQSGTAWYRLPAGHSLATTPPGYDHCGTSHPGWLSGWPIGADSVDTGGPLTERYPLDY
eukprot:SAG22_NODE_6906_length_796_cov_1.639885_1_plen_242_part_01